MPFVKLQFKPGLNRDQTNYSNEGSWYECDKIRFLSGYPQKIGGWAKHTPNSFLGTCRQLFNYVTSFTDNLLAVGTNLKLYIEAGGYFYDVTPLQETTAAGDVTFTATNGSSTVTVLDTATPAKAGNYVNFTGAASLGGNVTADVLNAEIGFEIDTVINANAFTIVVPVTANASDSGNGGASTIGKYQIDVGEPGGTFGYGWGTDPWGRLEWGLGGTTPVALDGRDWWYDNLDNDLIANIRDGAIYYWERGILLTPEPLLQPTQFFYRSTQMMQDSIQTQCPPKPCRFLYRKTTSMLSVLGVCLMALLMWMILTPFLLGGLIRTIRANGLRHLLTRRET